GRVTLSAAAAPGGSPMPLDPYCAALEAGRAEQDRWEARWLPFAPDPPLDVPREGVTAVLDELVARLADSYPFFHPHYAGQMLKPPHPIGQVAYALAMRINANNHALDGGPATSA